MRRTGGRAIGWDASAAAALLLSGCTASPSRVLACGAAMPPAVATAPDGTRSVTLTVLTYNIEGLGWPARGDRAPQLHDIGHRLSALRKAGQGPDVVLFQEMFSGPAKHAVRRTGYPAIVSGPSRTTPARDAPTTPLPGTARYRRGEIGAHIAGSGLAIASRYPIVASQGNAFGSQACAGLDCLSNKGIVMARIAVPGVPVPIDLYDTHFNSRHASRAPQVRTQAAHERQAQEAARFIERTRDPANPVILGGDFNMRHSEVRWETFSRYHTLALVHRVCADPASGCDVRMSWSGDAPWMNTEDLQFFGGSGVSGGGGGGAPVSVRPIRVEALFDGGAGGPMLSDHAGFLVTYRLSWAADAPVAPCGPTPRRR